MTITTFVRVSNADLTPAQLAERRAHLETKRIARLVEMGIITRKKLERPFTAAVLKHMSAATHSAPIDRRAKLVAAVAWHVNVQRLTHFTIDQARARHASVRTGAEADTLAPKRLVLLTRDYAKATDVMGMPVDVSDAALTGGMRYVCPATKRRREEALRNPVPTSKKRKAADAAIADDDDDAAPDAAPSAAPDAKAAKKAAKAEAKAQAKADAKAASKAAARANDKETPASDKAKKKKQKLRTTSE